jgi:hypothetical protein
VIYFFILRAYYINTYEKNLHFLLPFLFLLSLDIYSQCAVQAVIGSPGSEASIDPAINQIKVYPNPAKGHVFISFAVHMDFRIMDLTGRQVFSRTKKYHC